MKRARELSDAHLRCQVLGQALPQVQLLIRHVPFNARLVACLGWILWVGLASRPASFLPWGHRKAERSAYTCCLGSRGWLWAAARRGQRACGFLGPGISPCQGAQGKFEMALVLLW